MKEYMINFTEAQKQLGVSRSTLLRWLKDKKITGYKAGKKWKFYPADLKKVLIKEKTAEYSSMDNGKAIKLLFPLLPSELKNEKVFSADFWCEWQDISQWLAVIITKKNGHHEFDVLTSSARKRKIIIPGVIADKIISVWETWSRPDSDTAPRPGKYSYIAANANNSLASLQLPAKFEPAFKRKSRKEKDIYIFGPPERKTAFKAYSVLSEVAGKNDSILTIENEPTYYVPNALQLYKKYSNDTAIGSDIMLVQLPAGVKLPARGIISPKYRIAYSFLQ